MGNHQHLLQSDYFFAVQNCAEYCKRINVLSTARMVAICKLPSIGQLKSVLQCDLNTKLDRYKYHSESERFCNFVGRRELHLKYTSLQLATKSRSYLAMPRTLRCTRCHLLTEYQFCCGTCSHCCCPVDNCFCFETCKQQPNE